MAKNVFRSGEVKLSEAKVHISPPDPPKRSAFARLDSLDAMEQYTGPTADDLRREAEAFRRNWEEEKARMVAEAEAEAEQIRQDAEQRAFDEVKAKNDQAQKIRADAQAEADEILKKARAEAEAIIENARKEASGIEAEAEKRGREAGEEQGYESGRAEVERVIERLHRILNRAIDRRNEIIEESEAQLIHLVLQIAQKVVKVISENQRNIVINNVVQALRKLKSRSDIVIRVNIADLKLTTEHAEELTRTIERVGNITVMEDSTVDSGGAIIETDFGQIDARISSQLREIEDRILELAPIRAPGS